MQTESPNKNNFLQFESGQTTKVTLVDPLQKKKDELVTKLHAKTAKQNLAKAGKIIYVRDYSGKPFGVIALGRAYRPSLGGKILHLENDKMLMGWSFCNPEDKFSKDKGLVIAYRRLSSCPQLLNLRPFLCSDEHRSFQVLSCVIQALVGFIPQLEATPLGEMKETYIGGRTYVLFQEEYKPLAAAAKGCRSFARHVSNL